MTSPRVLHLGKYVPPEPGGIERFTFDLVATLHEQGLPVALLGHRAPGQHALQPKPYPQFAAGTTTRMIHIPVSPTFPIKLSQAIREFRPDLIHVHMPNASALALLASPAARRLPWVVHWHADVVASDIDRRIALAYRFYRPSESRILARAQRIIATSTAYANGSTPLTPWRDKVDVIPLGIEPGNVSTDGSSGSTSHHSPWPGAGLRLLFVGRLSYYKGVDHLIEALRGVERVHAVIAGDGAQRKELERRSKGAPVSFLGSVTDEERNRLLAGADALVLPSIEKTEAFGLVLLEAMVSRLPVIASDVANSGMGEVVRSGKHGLLVEPRSAESLRSAILRMRDEPQLLHELRHGIRDRFEQLFHIDAIAAQTRALYASVARSK